VKPTKSSTRILLIALCLALIAAAPASNPSTQIGVWFTRLADRDPSVREQARIDLMGLTRQDLPALRKQIKEQRPLAPSQAAALRDIVMHVYLSGEGYRADEDHGFLGVSLNDGTFPGVLPDAPQDPAAPPPLGVVVVERLPGLCAFRMLTNGDVIVGLAGHSDMPVRTAADLRTLITQTRAGEMIRLEVFRGGRIITVPVRLSARPAGVDTFDFMRERQRRIELADEFWQREFAPLVDDGVS
jgi:hypothetical protein